MATIESLYQDVLGRAPDTGGAAYWAAQFGPTIEPHEIATFQAAAAPEIQTQAEVASLYENVLGREADDPGLQYWVETFGPGGLSSGDVVAFVNAAKSELMGGEGAKTGAQTNVRTAPISPSQSTLSPNFADYVYRMLAKGEQAANMPFQEYTGQRFAGPSPLQLRAFSGIANLADPAAFAEAQRFMTMAGTPTRFTGSGQPAGITSLPEMTGAPVGGAASAMGNLPTVEQEFSRFGVTPGWIGQIPSTAIPTSQTLEGAFPEEAANFADGGDVTMTDTSNTTTAMPQTNQFQLGSVADYMSPYTGAVTDIAAREARRQADIGRTQEQARLAQAGAYGGSRQAIMEAERQRNLNTQIGDIATTGLQSAYDRALRQRTGEAELGLQAGQALGQLGAAQGQYGLNALNTTLNAGRVQQQIAQQPLDFGYEQWRESLAYPYQQATYMSSLLGGLPLAANPYSPGGSALGGGLAGLTSLLSLLAGITG